MNLIPIEDKLPHVVMEVVCLLCLKRWIAVKPTRTYLKELECPQCQEVGKVIATGEFLE